MEGRYKGNLTGEERRGGGGVGVDPTYEGVSSAASFDELSKARFKVILLLCFGCKQHAPFCLASRRV